MRHTMRDPGDRTLPILMLAYAATSLVHFAHNAMHLHEYPHMPVWLTPARVYAAWAALSALGACGYWLARRVAPAAGLPLIALYALCGFGGLEHYALAPMSAHSAAMNASIVAEAVAAGVLLWYVARYSPVLMRVQTRVRSR